MRSRVAGFLSVLIVACALASPCLGAAINTKSATESDKKALDRWRPLAVSLRDEAKKLLPELKAGATDSSSLTLKWARLNEETLILVERLESAELREVVKEMGTTLRNWHEDFLNEKERRERADIVERLADFLTERLKK